MIGDALKTQFNALGKIRLILDTRTEWAQEFVYGPDQQRWCSWLTDDISTVSTDEQLEKMKGSETSLKADGASRLIVNDLRTTIYAGNYEKVTEGRKTREFYYLDGGVIAVKQDGVFTPYLAFTDNLGSILAVYAADGKKVFDAEYDAWGKQTVALNEIGLQRGYTGHEMLNEFGIINMNGRLYDPELGRFFSPDNYVQAPDNSQNFNRYSYCLNNPLKYNDPSGEVVTWSIGKHGFSIGWNFISSGIPVGFGLNFGWSDGFSMGAYGEVGPRVGGDYFGGGATASIGGDYNFKSKGWSMTYSSGGYASFCCFNASASASMTYDFNSGQMYPGWNVGAGIGFGKDYGSIGFNVSYGSGGWSYGMGGYFSKPQYHDMVANGINKYKPATIGEDVKYNSVFAWLFGYFNLPDFCKYVSIVYADGTLPKGYTMDENGHVWNKSDQMVFGCTPLATRGNKSIIYLFPDAFSCAEQLYLVMRHEVTHAYFNYEMGPVRNGSEISKRRHASIYRAQMEQAIVWGFQTDYYINRFYSDCVDSSAPAPFNTWPYSKYYNFGLDKGCPYIPTITTKPRTMFW